MSDLDLYPPVEPIENAWNVWVWPTADEHDAYCVGQGAAKEYALRLAEGAGGKHVRSGLAGEVDAVAVEAVAEVVKETP